MNIDNRSEDELLQSVAMQNATTVFLARQRAEEELLRTKEALEARTQELMRSLAVMEGTLEERDRARLEAENAKRQAQDANEAKARFLRMMSHELRTPLGAIGGYAALMEEGIHGPLTQAQRESVGRIRYNQQHLLRLVDELLDFARLEAGHYRVNCGPIDLAAVVEGALPMIELQLAEKNVRLEVDLDSGAGEAYGDPERVQQIVVNLLSNAAKFTESGGVATIRTIGREQMVDLHVEDTGIGIAPDKQDEVFESFMQVAPSIGKTGGTGLGLAISRQLALAMGGDLKVKSALGKGSTFTLSMPRLDH